MRPMTLPAFLLSMALAASAALAEEQAQQQPGDGAPAATPAQTPAAGPKPAPGSLDEVVCKIRTEPVAGTRISRKREICRTRREWTQDEQIAQGALREIHKDGGSNSNIKGAKGN